MGNNRWWRIVDLLVWTSAIFVFIGLFLDLDSHAWDNPQFGDQVVFRIRFVVLYLFLFNVVVQSFRRIRAKRPGRGADRARGAATQSSTLAVSH